MAVDVEPRLAVAHPKPRAQVADERPTEATASQRRRLLSGISRPILTVNLSALLILGFGLFYLDDYEKGLVLADIEAMRTQGDIVAAAIGEIAVEGDAVDVQRLNPDGARRLIRRLVDPMKARARLFTPDGELVADSRMLGGAGSLVQIMELPPPRAHDWVNRTSIAAYDWVVAWLPRRPSIPHYFEAATQRADDYEEVRRALLGETRGMIRTAPPAGASGLVVSVAVPVQRYRQVLGALLLSHSGADVERAVRAVRLDIVKVFGIPLGFSVLFSLYLVGTIARPIRRLAAAADRVRHGHGRLQQPIPNFAKRDDEIGDLSEALRDMTDALWNRMDAIERFAADVAHEIKNPLSSMRSAVETVARVDDPEQQRRLLAIIQDDTQRLDRLISDISDASRLDAELSRAELAPVRIDQMLKALVEVHDATAEEPMPQFRLRLSNPRPLDVLGIESRLVQVFDNLIANAVSFSPPGGTIVLEAARDGRFVKVTVEDAGPGIPDDKRQAIFDRFYSERPAGEKFGTHSGLGLSISKQIAEAHGGSLVAENRRDDASTVIGARFIVRLPAD
jgi:two-component system sensor histidine kinase ChvG